MSSPTFEPDGAKHALSHPCPLRLQICAMWGYVLSLSCNVFGNYGNCLLQIVYFQTQKIPKEKNQLKALKNQVSERERAEKVHIASALFLLSL